VVPEAERPELARQTQLERAALRSLPTLLKSTASFIRGNLWRGASSAVLASPSCSTVDARLALAIVAPWLGSTSAVLVASLTNGLPRLGSLAQSSGLNESDGRPALGLGHAGTTAAASG